METNSYAGNRPLGERIHIIDAARGISILLMVIYHFHVDLYLFGILPKELINHPAVVFLQEFFACVFILASGISCRFSRNNLKRGLVMLAAGMAVTAVTYLFSQELYVRFGILHFLGVSAIIYSLAGKALDRLLPGILTPVVCVPLAVLTWTLRFETFDVKHLWVFGITGPDFSSADYFPLLPFFFVYLVGTWLGKYISAGLFPRWFYTFKCRPLSFFGRNTIWIYLAHQPIFFGILYLIIKP